MEEVLRSATTHRLKIMSFVRSTITWGSIDGEHIVVTIMTSREEATKFILGAYALVRHPIHDSRIKLRRTVLTPETLATDELRAHSLIS
jgi:hypothetical protein